MADVSRVKELQRALETKAAAIQNAASAFTIEDNGGVVVTEEVKADYLQQIAEAQQIKALLAAEIEVKDIREWMDSGAGTPAAAQEAAAAQRGGHVERKSLGDHFISSEAFKNARSSSDPRIKVEIADSIYSLGQTKDVFGTSAGRAGGDYTIPSLGGAQDIGITELRLRQRHVRDLFPHATTTAAVLHGVRETGFTNNAAAVPVRVGGAFGLKPTSTLTLASIVYPVATIAHILRAHRNILDDEPRLKDFLNRRMVDGVKLAEDDAMLYGDGTGENITGIMNVSGIQSYTGLAGDPRTAQIRRAATLAMIAEYEPNGIVVHPLDWEDLELETDQMGQYRLAVNVAVGAEKRVWTMDVVATTAMHSTQFLLGAFGLGAQLYDREQVNVLLSTEDSDNFQRNAVTLRGEERIAMTVDRPESFVAGSFTVPS